MLCFEDKKLEKAVISKESCIAVPLEVYVPALGEPRITTYSFLAEEAKRLEEAFGDNLLGKRAMEYIETAYKTIAEKMGYEHFEHENSLMLEYEISDDRQLNKKLICDNCIKINSQDMLDRLCDNSGCEIELTDENDVVFAVVNNDTILSYAGINDIPSVNNSLEISVETATRERRRGYGAAAVTALCEYIIGKGKKVVYKCSAENIASSALALKCGFEHTGTRYSYVCSLK